MDHDSRPRRQELFDELLGAFALWRAQLRAVDAAQPQFLAHGNAKAQVDRAPERVAVDDAVDRCGVGVRGRVGDGDGRDLFLRERVGNKESQIEILDTRHSTLGTRGWCANVPLFGNAFLE